MIVSGSGFVWLALETRWPSAELEETLVRSRWRPALLL